MPAYITDLALISPQPTHDGLPMLGRWLTHSGAEYRAIEPDYSGTVPNSLLRRMGPSVRMATGAGMALLGRWPTDGILLATTNGGMGDCLKFLNQLVDYDEGTLTPTGFVQGSPSAVAGGLALMARNTGYNATHSNKGLSFESALMDALLLFSEGTAQRLLVGAVEEIAASHSNIERLAGHLKTEGTTADRLLSSGTPGSVNGEGAAMFILSAQGADALCSIEAIGMMTLPEEEEWLAYAEDFLGRNGLNANDVDTLVLGLSGDIRSDHWYTAFSQRMFPTASVLAFKPLFGDSPSASAFGTWLAARAIAGEPMPPLATVRNTGSKARTVLVYNHYQQKQHGLVLLRHR